MIYTENYQLRKPQIGVDNADVKDLNFNSDRIDTIMHNTQISMATAYDATRTSSNPYNTGDIVMYEMIAYKCLEDGVYGTWDASKWEQTTLADNLGGGDASEISYDNTSSGLTATDVQSAIDELEGNIEDAVAGLEDAVESLAPAYDSTETYDEGDIVSYENKLYECNTDNTTGSWDSQYWDEYIISEHMGASVSITPETIAEPKAKIADFIINGVSDSLYAPLIQIEGHASGAIATFTDGGDNKPLKSLKVAINPLQASGTPTPENPLPIYGWTGANVTRCGKNCFDVNSITVSNITFNTADGEATRSGFFYHLPPGTYTFKCNSVTVYSYIYVNVFNANGEYVNRYSLSTTSSGGWRTVTITINEGQYLAIYASSAQATLNPAFNLQIEIGSSATDYEPYNGTTYTIQLGDTYYGGTLDMTSGVMTVDRKKIILTGADVPQGISTTYIGSIIYNFQSQKFADIDYSKKMSCNLLNFVGRTTANFVYGTFISSSSPSVNLWIKDGAFADSAEVATWLNNNNLEILCYLATPFTVQLTPTQIKSLLGQNNFYTDCGDIDELTYIRDINLGFNALWDAVMNSNSGTRSLSLSKGATTETKEEVKEELKEEPKEEEQNENRR